MKNPIFFFSIIGMDIGGSNTCMAILEPSGARVIENAEGFRTTPNYVTFIEPDEENPHENALVTINSKKQSIQYSKDTFYGLKYLFSNDKDIIEKIISSKKFDYKIEVVSEGENKGLTENITLTTSLGTTYNPYEASSYYLKYCKEQADELLGKNIKKVVLSLPYFLHENPISKSDYKKSLNKVGLEPIHFIEESKSTILAYGAEKKRKVIVINLGGTGFNISYLENNKENTENNEENNKEKENEEKQEKEGKEAKEGKEGEKEEEKEEENKADPLKDISGFELKEYFSDHFLGGDDFDIKITEVLVEEFNKKNKIDITQVPSAMQRIREAAEKAKIELTLSNQVEINLPFLMADQTGPKHMLSVITRSKFERYIDDLTSKVKKHCEEFKKKVIANHDEKFLENLDDILLVGGITRIPCVQDLIKQVFKKEPNTTLNPEEAPTIGACIIADSLKSKSEEKVSFEEELPLSVGIKTIGGRFSRLIEKGEPLPQFRKFKLSTCYDNQPTISVAFYMGERELADDNRLLGEVKKKLPLAKKGELSIDCSIRIDDEGIMNIKITESTLSKKSLNYSIDLGNGLNPEILEDVLEVSKKFKEVDDMKISNINLRSEIDEFLYVYNNELKKIKKNMYLNKMKEEGLNENEDDDDKGEKKEKEEKTKLEFLIEKSEDICKDIELMLKENTDADEISDIVSKYEELNNVIEEISINQVVEEEAGAEKK